MLFNNPISSEKADRIIQLLNVPADGRILDIGCGNGEFLIRLIEAAGAHGLGIDIDSNAVSAARQKAARRLSDSSYEFQTADIQETQLEAGSFDLAICFGSTHAFGEGETAYPNALKRMTDLVRPGCMLLVGEGYWKRPPAQPYLELIGDPVGIYQPHAGNISLAEQHGLVPLYAVTANEDEWDDFEWSHRMRIEREAALNPDDPDTITKVNRSREWRSGYLRWGRSTMGFGLYLFMKPLGGPMET